MTAARTFAARVAEAFRGMGPTAAFVLVLGVAGGLLIMLAEPSTIVRVDVLTTGTCEEIADPGLRDRCDLSGFEQHGGAFLLLGALAVVMAVGASRRWSRPAALALVSVGAVVLMFSIVRDVPKADESGPLGFQFEDAEATAGRGIYFEIVGGGLCALAGLRQLAHRRTREPV